jgi:hypothetical protein
MTTAFWCLLSAALAAPTGVPPAGPAYIQAHGAGRLVIEGGEVQEGKVRVPLSGQLRVVVSVQGDAGLEAEPIKAVEPAASWQVHGPAAPPQKIALPGSRVRWQQQLVIEPLQPGEGPLAVPPLRYRTGAAADWQALAWDPVPVQVTTEASADLKQLRDITPPERPDVAPAPPLWPALAALGVALLALATVLWVRRRRRPAPPAPLPPAAWALRELDRLEALDIPARGEWSRYHTLLADTVRRYLELRFGVPAPQRTTAEFLEAVRATSHLTEDQQAQLAELLRRCDLAKFAAATPSVEECRAAILVARTFVEQSAAAPLAPARQPTTEQPSSAG